jgi:hypothetical protein
MSELETRLAAFFAKDEPPARDPEFQARVMKGVQRVELFDAAVDAAGPVVAGGAAIWAGWPTIAPLVASFAGISPVAWSLGVAAASIGLTYYWITRRQPAY